MSRGREGTCSAPPPALAVSTLSYLATTARAAAHRPTSTCGSRAASVQGPLALPPFPDRRASVSKASHRGTDVAATAAGEDQIEADKAPDAVASV